LEDSITEQQQKTVRLVLTKDLNMKKPVPKLYLESQQLAKTTEDEIHFFILFSNIHGTA
jgi:hypothetical protein